MPFKSKPKIAPKGARTRVIYAFSNSMDMTYRFTAEPVTPGEAVTGTVEVRGSSWIFPKPPRTQTLVQDNQVHKGVWDTMYSVHVIPDCDVTITREGSSFGDISRLLILVSIVITAAVAVVAFGLLRQ